MRKDTYKFKIQNSKFKIIFYITPFYTTFIPYVIPHFGTK